MGFMDKAKKLAEQAQEKLDDAQKQFNERQGAGASASQGPAVEYDKHGRPISTSEPVPTPTAEPAAPAPESPAPPPHGDPVAGDQPATPPPPGPTAPVPDPAAPPEGQKPDEYAPPKMTSGDPLAP
jgi:hypothetical protein